MSSIYTADLSRILFDVRVIKMGCALHLGLHPG